jgi:hypothetical protein
MSVLIKKPTALLVDYVRRYIATDISKEIRASVGHAELRKPMPIHPDYDRVASYLLLW